MVRWLLIFCFIFIGNSLFAKEWKNLKTYQKQTQNQSLFPSDWLRADRIKNTSVWQSANAYNLQNNLYNEYESIVQRRDFYKWLYLSLDSKEHDILWVKIAHFISKKLHVMEIFPYSIFTTRKVKFYAKEGSQSVFKNAFTELKTLFSSSEILKGKEADAWDKTMLKREQFIWVESIYKTIDKKSLHTLERIAKGKCLYGLVVPKSIRFKGALSSKEVRYTYAVEVLKLYCKNRYKS